MARKFCTEACVATATISDELDEDDITSAILGECTQACLCHPAAYTGIIAIVHIILMILILYCTPL